MNFNIIVAVDNKNGIGYNNTIPWYEPDDLKHFSKTTKGNLNNAIIMGSKLKIIAIKLMANIERARTAFEGLFKISNSRFHKGIKPAISSFSPILFLSPLFAINSTSPD